MAILNGQLTRERIGVTLPRSRRLTDVDRGSRSDLSLRDHGPNQACGGEDVVRQSARVVIVWVAKQNGGEERLPIVLFILIGELVTVEIVVGQVSNDPGGAGHHGPPLALVSWRAGVPRRDRLVELLTQDPELKPLANRQLTN